MAAKTALNMLTCSDGDEEDTVVYIYDRRRGNAPEKKIHLGGIFDFAAFRTKVRQALEIGPRDKFVISTTNRLEIRDDNTYEDLIEGGDTLYVLNHMNQELGAPTQERIDYLPHYDTLVKSGMYEYYASEGQNPLPFAFAELIDNALAATAANIGPRTIELRLFLDESQTKNHICVVDNGCGMTSRQLNNWAIYRLSKFIRKEKKGSCGRPLTIREIAGFSSCGRLLTTREIAGFSSCGRLLTTREIAGFSSCRRLLTTREIAGFSSCGRPLTIREIAGFSSCSRLLTTREIAGFSSCGRLLTTREIAGFSSCRRLLTTREIAGFSSCGRLLTTREIAGFSSCRRLLTTREIAGFSSCRRLLTTREIAGFSSCVDVDFEYLENYAEDRPARGNRPIFECYWNGRLIPYTFIDDFDWNAVSKKRGPIPVECYNRLSGVLWTNDKFQVSTNKLTFLDLELKLKDKNTVFNRVVQGQTQRVKIERAFSDWIRECHEQQDKQVMFSGYSGSVSRPEIPVKRHQSPWAVYKSIEWDSKVFETGQLEPQLLYDEIKAIPLTKLDRNAPKSAIKKYIEEEEGRLPEKIVVSWPEGDALIHNEKRAAGKTIGAIQVEIHNRKGEPISRLPGSIHSSKKLLVELKIVWHAPHGDERIVSHISQHGKAWGYWFRKMENVKNLGVYSLKLQVVLNESSAKEFGGKELPSCKIKFTVTEAAPAKFSVGMMDPPFRVGEPFNIPLDLQDEFGHPTKPTSDIKPKLETNDLSLKYESLLAKGCSLIVKGVTADGIVGSHHGKSFNLKVTLPGLEEPMQTLKLRLLPGPPRSLHIVVPEDDEIVIENGRSLSIEVEVRDKAGNPTVQPKLNVTCRLIGAPGLPSFSADCSNTGKATLTCNSVNVKNFKKDLKITARIELQHFRDIPAQEKIIRISPSTKVSKIEVYHTDHNDVETKLKHHQDLLCTAGDSVTGLTFKLYDEGNRVLKITPEIASKIRVHWTPKFNKELLLKEQLPNVKVPNSTAETKYCQVSLSEAGIEFAFTLKPISGEPSQLKCTCKGNKKIALGQKLEGDIIISITDSHGNPVKKLPSSTLATLQVFGKGLVINEMVRAPYQTHGFLLENIKFTGVPLGMTELLVKWKDLSDYVKLELVAGPPAKIAVVDIPIDQPVLVYNDNKLDKPLILQLCDECDNPTTDSNGKILLGKDPRIK
uniref:Structural maintenance of chromosomes flexible hinge domain-containing protein 1-like n=1 Tax=Saccoglossus kowalevskii TaxID=10224 RepID=A0ABM0MF63_SACKO